jgi:formate-dependent nitrite reductase cytochrome c552 subunit
VRRPAGRKTGPSGLARRGCLPGETRFAGRSAALETGYASPTRWSCASVGAGLESRSRQQLSGRYYFKGEGKLLTYPWHNGLKVEQIEAYYDDEGWTDWTHATSGAPVLKAQHPEFELWSQGIHARTGVACADCHMSYKRDWAIKISNHHVRSPLLNISRACQQCHNFAEAEILSRAEAIQDRTKALLGHAEDAVISAIHAIQAAREGGASDGKLQAARKLHRQAQWRLDFVAAENSLGFHAPQEKRLASWPKRLILPGNPRSRSCNRRVTRRLRRRGHCM